MSNRCGGLSGTHGKPAALLIWEMTLMTSLTVYPEAATLWREVEAAREAFQQAPTAENDRRIDQAWAAYAAYIGLHCTAPVRRRRCVRAIR